MLLSLDFFDSSNQWLRYIIYRFLSIPYYFSINREIRHFYFPMPLRKSSIIMFTSFSFQSSKLLISIHNISFIRFGKNKMRITVPRFAKFSQLVSLEIKQANKAAFITMCNPKKRNTLSSSAMKEMIGALSQVQKSVDQKKTKIVFIKGDGPVFSSGHDLKEIQASKNPQEIFDLCESMMLQVRNFPTPIVAVVNGIAAAAGFQLTMACDMVLASQKSTFSCPGIKWGLFCSTPGVELIRSISSEKKANQMLMLGEQITAQQAFNYGIINRVAADQAALNQQIQSFIEKANKLSGQVVIHGKKVLREQKAKTVQEAYKIAGVGMSDNITTKDDCKQGLAAFSQKRHPHFKN